jgi:transcriptional regulator with XRE-family HTH domain
MLKTLTFSEILQITRASLGLPLTTVACRSGLSIQEVRAVETNHVIGLSLHDQLALARGLGLTPVLMVLLLRRSPPALLVQAAQPLVLSRLDNDEAQRAAGLLNVLASLTAISSSAAPARRKALASIRRDLEALDQPVPAKAPVTKGARIHYRP